MLSTNAHAENRISRLITSCGRTIWQTSTRWLGSWGKPSVTLSGEAVASWLNENYNGLSPMPLGLLKWKSPTGEDFSITVGKIASLSEDFQKIIKMLKEDSLSNPEMPFREVAAFYVPYRNLPYQTMIFTSDRFDRVHHETHRAAADQLGLLDTGSPQTQGFKYVVHFHTHPGPEYRKGTSKERANIALLPNLKDMKNYKSWSDVFTASAGRTVPVTGIVLPMGRMCDDTYFMVTVYPDPSEVRKIKENFELHSAETH